MFVRLTKATKSWGATIVVSLYAVCVLAPTVAFALGDRAHAVHCLIEDHHGSTAIQVHQHSDPNSHVHASGLVHEHSKPPHDHSKAPEHKGKTSDAQCCGLAFTSALPAVLTEVPVLAAPRACEIWENQQGVASLAPDRLYKPPIDLLSL
jgi:hypothetical protein